MSRAVHRLTEKDASIQQLEASHIFKVTDDLFKSCSYPGGGVSGILLLTTKALHLSLTFKTYGDG